MGLDPDNCDKAPRGVHEWKAIRDHIDNGIYECRYCGMVQRHVTTYTMPAAVVDHLARAENLVGHLIPPLQGNAYLFAEMVQEIIAHLKEQRHDGSG